MNVLVTGATGVIGRQAIPRLLQAGHEVAGMARSAAAAGWLRAVGATPVQVDLFDPAMVAAAVTDADTVVHLATAIPPLARMRRPNAWRTNDRLRIHATRKPVDAAIAAGAEVLVLESISFNYADGSAARLDEFTRQRPRVRNPCHAHLTKGDPRVDNDAQPFACTAPRRRSTAVGRWRRRGKIAGAKQLTGERQGCGSSASAGWVRGQASISRWWHSSEPSSG